MLFNSYVFVLVFLPLVTGLWWRLRGAEARLGLLTVASYVFYGWCEPRFTLLLFWTTAVDYALSWRIHRAAGAARRRWLMLSAAGNLATLGIFKYYDWFAGSVSTALHALGCDASLPVLGVVLPVGISFYTFQSLSYTADVYRGEIEPAPSFLHFACFVAMFHQLVAGPIVRYSELTRQLEKLEPAPVWREMSLGVVFFTAGLVKKLCVADPIAALVDPMLAQHAHLGFLGAWTAVVGYMCQLYFDFSGYSDMAVGLGLWYGFKFARNFDSPYRADSVTDYWRRWHLTLGDWMRDYVFIPLGGSRCGVRRTAANLFVTFLLAGIWHGAAWNFVVFGLWMGVTLALHYLWRRAGYGLPRRWAQVCTLIVMGVTYALFRATSLEMAGHLLRAMYTGAGPRLATEAAAYGWTVAVVVAAMGACVCLPNVWEMRFRPRPAHAVALAAAMAGCILLMEAPSPFLYFQF